MDRKNIEKIAQNQEDKIFLAKIWDKIYTGIQKNIPANTPFLSPREQYMAQCLFGNISGLRFFGGYENATRKMLIFLPDYLDDSFWDDTLPFVCLRAKFYSEDSLSHRDFLGALMGAGIGRETVGDICVNKGSCDFFVTKEVGAYILQNFTSAGRSKLHLEEISLEDLRMPTAEFIEIKDTLASLRLDNVLCAGFSLSRATATEGILSGRASINGLPCTKPDKAVEAGATISLRGAGKMELKTINGKTKKGRISVVINRFK